MSIVVSCVNFSGYEVWDAEYDAWLEEISPWPPSPEEEVVMIEYYKQEYPELFEERGFSRKAA